MLPFFQESGKTPVLRDVIKILKRRNMIEFPDNLIIRMDMQSCPCALLGLRFLILQRISSRVNSSELMRFSVRKESGGKTLVFIHVVHWFAKKVLKTSAFRSKFVSSKPSCLNGRNSWNFLFAHESIYQYV